MLEEAWKLLSVAMKRLRQENHLLLAKYKSHLLQLFQWQYYYGCFHSVHVSFSLKCRISGWKAFHLLKRIVSSVMLNNSKTNLVVKVRELRGR